MAQSNKSTQSSKPTQSSRDVEYHLAQYKRKLQKSGTSSEVRKREHYVKPGVKRAEAKKEGKKNANKRNKAANYRD